MQKNNFEGHKNTNDSCQMQHATIYIVDPIVKFCGKYPQCSKCQKLKKKHHQ